MSAASGLVNEDGVFASAATIAESSVSSSATGIADVTAEGS